MDKNEEIIEILHNQVKPALGCTEPGAVALAVSRAVELLGEPVNKVSISIDQNVLKNGAGVGIPGTTERGNAFAAALAMVCGKFAYGLEVLKDADEAAIEQANVLLSNGAVEMKLNPEAEGLEIAVDAQGDHHQSKVMIAKSHTNIVYEARDGQALLDAAAKGTADSPVPAVSLQHRIQQYTIRELVNLAKTLPEDSLLFIQDGIEMNMRMARTGLERRVGVGIGRHMMQKFGNTMEGKAKAYTAAASEARMAGWPLPVMSSAGSGNHGLTAIIPIHVFGRELGLSEDWIRRSVALSHMVTIFVKSYLGVLSPICGCGVAAGVGCAAGLTFLRGGTDHQIDASILNMISGLTGMLCDGAKLGCAYKLAVSVDAAIDASDMALGQVHIPGDNGILNDSPEQSIRNMARVSVQGMENTDRVIVDIMREKC